MVRVEHDLRDVIDALAFLGIKRCSQCRQFFRGADPGALFDCEKLVCKCQRKRTVDGLNPRATVTPPFNQQTLRRLVFVPSSRMITAG